MDLDQILQKINERLVFEHGYFQNMFMNLETRINTKLEAIFLFLNSVDLELFGYKQGESIEQCMDKRQNYESMVQILFSVNREGYVNSKKQFHLWQKYRLEWERSLSLKSEDEYL